jgi:hypothetical protein
MLFGGVEDERSRSERGIRDADGRGLLRQPDRRHDQPEQGERLALKMAAT